MPVGDFPGRQEPGPSPRGITLLGPVALVWDPQSSYTAVPPTIERPLAEEREGVASGNPKESAHAHLGPLTRPSLPLCELLQAATLPRDVRYHR